MGLFSSDTKKETSIVLNFNTFATDGSAVGITNEPTKDKMQHRRHVVVYYGRDFNESDKDFETKIKERYLVPVHEGFLLINQKWSEYKPIYMILPNEIKDLPIGIDPRLKKALSIVILEEYTRQTVIDFLRKGILSRDDMLKEIYSLEFAKDYKQQIETWVDETAKKHGQQLQSPSKPDEKK